MIFQASLFRFLSLSFLISIAAVLMFGAVHAKPGDLDRSFGAGVGDVTIDLNGDDVLSDLAIQSNGKLILAGACGDRDDTKWVCLTRLTVAGNSDTTFGVSGAVVAGVAPLAPSFGETAWRQVSIVLDSSDRIVVASLCQYQFCVRRFLADGSIDTSFGIGGLAGPLSDSRGMERVGTTSELKVALLHDKEIVVVSTCRFVCFIRLTEHGRRDDSFGTHGFVSSTADFSAEALVVAPDNSMYVSGFCQDISDTHLIQSYCTARFRADGSVVESYGLQGLSKVAFVHTGLAFSNALGSDGSLLVGGVCNFLAPVRPVGCVAKLNPSGVLSSSFGEGGIARVLALYSVNTITIDANGKIVIGGSCETPSGLEQRCISRVNSDGSADTGFGSAGNVRVPAGAYRDWISRVRIDKSGKILATGTCFPPYGLDGFFPSGTLNFCVTRLHASQSRFDIDNDNESRPSSDAVLYIRHLLGFRDNALILGALGTYADRIAGAEIDIYLRGVDPTYPNCSESIVGAPAGPSALLDGLILMRAMAGLSGDVVTNGLAFPAGAARTTWDEIKTHLVANCGMILN
jgi:uncharacterized delta-60 repeat protein